MLSRHNFAGHAAGAIRGCPVGAALILVSTGSSQQVTVVASQRIVADPGVWLGTPQAAGVSFIRTVLATEQPGQLIQSAASVASRSFPLSKIARSERERVMLLPPSRSSSP